ncbi:MAG TPA: alpha/beta hydrolase [Ruminococcaceae bacterium]|nr:alpha/beta hydrolase [Oscillospiraceae bacterium]
MRVKTGKRKKRIIILLAIVSVIAVFFIVQYILCSNAVKAGYARLETYNHKEIKLSYGTMTYVDEGSGDVILSVHGMSGGYDQAFDTVANRVGTNRVIAPSRFGYLGSDVPEAPSPKQQAKAFVELLDLLGIEKVHLLATSAGGTVAIRFALDYPERTNGLILYSSAAPLTAKPESYAEYAGPPEFLCSNFGMWLLSPFFEPIMGMESDVIHTMLPVSERREGMILDARQVNPDMARNFDEYDIESLQVPTLIFHAKDDKMADYTLMEQAAGRFPYSTFISFGTGGHLMSGHGGEIDNALDAFIEGSYSS